MVRHKLLKAIAVMGSHAGAKDGELFVALTDAGFTKLEAQLLEAFVPMAFSRPVLEDLGVAHFSEFVSAKTRTGRWEQVPLALQPVYVTALEIAREHRCHGLIDNKVFKTLSTSERDFPEPDNCQHVLSIGRAIFVMSLSLLYSCYRSL